MIYLVIYSIFFINTLKGEKKKIILKIMYLLLVLLTGLRYQIGQDYNVYFSLFNTITFWGRNINYEAGFIILVKIIKLINANPFFVFFIISLLTYILIYKGLKKSSLDSFLSLFLYYAIYMIPFSFNAIGQSIVVAIFIYLFDDIENKKVKKVIFYTVVATFIHTSGILIILAYIFYHLKISKRALLLLGISSFFIYLFSDKIYMVTIICSPDFISEKLLSYSGLYPEKIRYKSILQRLVMLLFMTSLGIKDKKNYNIFKIYFFGLLLYIILGFNSLYSTRINLFFKVTEIILLPNLIHRNKNKILNKVVISIFALLILITNFFYKANFPYKSIFNYYFFNL